MRCEHIETEQLRFLIIAIIFHFTVSHQPDILIQQIQVCHGLSEVRFQVEVVSPRLGQDEEEAVLLTEPEENVLERGAASLVSLGKYDLPPLPTLLVLSVQNLLRVWLILRHLQPSVL